MMFNSGTPSLADIAAVTDNKNSDGFGGGNGWWVLIILFALFGGWGNNNRDNNASNNAYYTDAVVQRGFDTQSVVSKLDGINSGISSLGYDQLAQMNGINTNIMQGTNTLSNAICSLGYNLTAGQNAIGNQLAQCCCANERESLQNRYDAAKNTCDIITAINQASQNIMQNDNCNYRQLHDEFVEYRLAAKDAEIQRQSNTINFLNLKSSQAEQNEYLLGKLQPSPVPAFVVSGPTTSSSAA